MKITQDVQTGTATSVHLALLRLAENWVKITLATGRLGNGSVDVKTNRSGTTFLRLRDGLFTVTIDISYNANSISVNYQRSHMVVAGVCRTLIKANIIIFKKMPYSDRIDILEQSVPMRPLREIENQIANDLRLLLAETGIVK